MKFQILVAGAILFLFALGFSERTYALKIGFGESQPGVVTSGTPGPTLLFPVTDDIKLSGKKDVEFRWETDNLAFTDHYVFQLFKGYQTVAATMILDKKYPLKDLPIKLPASMFEEGQVYTWGLQQVFLNGAKGDWSFSPFKIIKK